MKILVVSPHPDDETLGAGGLIIKHKNAGDQVYWLNVTDVEEGQEWSGEFVKKRKSQIENIIDFYGFDGTCNLKFRPSSLERIDKSEMIDKFGAYIRDIAPDWVVLPNPDDAHSDHKVTYEVGMTCTKSFRYPFVKRIMTMEIISETDFSKDGEAFSPNYFVDISNIIEDKIEALNIYDTELGEAPFPRSIDAVKALALLRGGACGCKYAEAFKIIKDIDKE